MSTSETATSSASFGSLQQVDAGVLDVGYAEPGPADGPAVVLLHGGPYDIHTDVDLARLLAAEGDRVVIPHPAKFAAAVIAVAGSGA
jgi:pimeloyl-ACP methyl ester carboxylesterase